MQTSLLTLFAGSLGRQQLNEIFLSDHPEIAGPFQGANSVQHFQDACDIDIKEDVLIVFTHDDIVPPNIILTSGLNPRVAAAADWGRAGYPAYWEYCKARWVIPHPGNFSDELEEGWRTRYLPMILDLVDDETIYHLWLYFAVFTT